MIMPGIKIGKNAIVGAQSVVTKNVKPNQIVAGNPAREIGLCESQKITIVILYLKFILPPPNHFHSTYEWKKSINHSGGLGFIGSNLAERLVEDGAHVTIVDSMIPEYGGNIRNIHEISDKVTVNLSDIRDPFSVNKLICKQDYLFNLAGQTSHLDSMEDPFTDLDINAKAQLSILEACRKHNFKVRKSYLPVPDKFMGSPNIYRLTKSTPCIR